MLIRAYGQFWNPDTVDWGGRGRGNTGRLLGKIKRRGVKHTINFWDAKGIYVLHADFKAVYVGKADSARLGPRLRSHLADRFAGRWDMFSWFAISTVATMDERVRDPGKRWAQPGDVINTLEALAILVADPALNRKRETFPQAHEAEQIKSPHPRTVRRYLEEILARVGQKSGR
jgi:hypothetical protein